MVNPTDISIRGWPPGMRKDELSLEVPGAVKPGRYKLSFGIIPPGTQTPTVRLANLGRDSEGWYQLSELQVEP